MKKVQVISEFSEYVSAAELPVEEKELLTEAEAAAKTAYAPYSKFKVGAAVLLDNGQIVCGSNHENASYPLALCAEQVALFAASGQHPGIRLTPIAVEPSSQNPPHP